MLGDNPKADTFFELTSEELGGPVLCLLAVNQENENSVKRTLNACAEQKIDFVSLFSPDAVLAQRSK